MCGFIGWINLQRNLRCEIDTMEKMTKTLCRRGPDDSGIYITDNALLGHRRLTVVDPEGGAQPMTRTAGENSYTVIYNGELYNTEEIRSKLLNKGYSFKSYSDTEVLLTSYIEWGETCVHQFNGIFAFGIWDEKSKKLFMARDPLGVKPLFYCKKGDNLFFGSELKAILANPMVDALIDSEGLCEIIGLGPARSPGNAVFKDICEVPPAHCMIYEDNRFKLREYWKLECKEHPDDLDTTIEKVRYLVVDAVERQLVSDVPVCTFLSGGLDSSIISAIAAKAFKEKNMATLNTFSIDYQDNDKYFKPDDFQPNSDSYWAEVMSKYIGSRHNSIIINTEHLVEALEEAVTANDLPGMADIDSSLLLFCREVRKQATVALSGECADEIFGGYPWFWKPEFTDTGTFPWSNAIKERRSILSKEFSNLPVEDYVDTKYSMALREVPILAGEPNEDKRIRELFYLNLKWFMITLLNRKDRMSMHNSLEVRVPFADYRIVEYVFNIPWSMKYCDNREKGLLRRAAKGILPDEILERKKSPYPKTHNPEYVKAIRLKMNNVLSDKYSPILRLIDADKVRELAAEGGKSFTKPWYGQLMKGPQLIAYLIQINAWMKKYNVKLV
ncbi:MAG: asparagine synthase (glutamine-hydrolyzing) [Bacillota bacterium]